MNYKYIVIIIILVFLSTSFINAADNETDTIKAIEYNNLTIIDNNENSIQAESDVGTFTELQSKISGSKNNVVTLYKDYAYNEKTDSDLVNGIPIPTYGITINGNNHVINGSDKARIFHVYNSNVIIKNVIFSNGYKNDYESSKGGAIYYEYDVIDSQIINSTFINNYAGSNGGAVYWTYTQGGWDKSTNQIINSTFINNRASTGGGLYWEGFGTFNIINSNFENNYASFGSSIYAYAPEDLTITNSQFNDKRQALYLNGKNIILKQNTLSKNDYIYLYDGNINSKTKIIALNNETRNNFNDISAILSDDNNNRIALSYKYSDLYITINGKSQKATQTNGIWTTEYTNENEGTYIVSANQGNFSNSQILTGTIIIKKEQPKQEITITTSTENNTLNINIIPDAQGTITLTINQSTKEIPLNPELNGQINIEFEEDGEYQIIINYSGDEKYLNKTIIESIIIKHEIIENTTIPENTTNNNFNSSNENKTDADLNDSEDDVNGTGGSGSDLSDSVDDVNGTGDVGSDLDNSLDGNDSSDVDSNSSSGSGDSDLNNQLNNSDLSNVKDVILIKNNLLTTYYNSGAYYKVRVYKNGNIASGKVTFILNGKKTTVKIDKNGWAKIKVANKNLKHKTYKISMVYNDVTVSNKVKVKTVIKAKKITKVKKSSKVKITLKGKKVIKNKKITIKFKGKTYKLKTNKKGIAIFKVNKKLLKKGKKYSYTVKYGKDTLKRYVILK